MPVITYIKMPPSAAIFAQFREKCGWGMVSDDLAKIAISNSLVFITAYKGDELVGFGRVIGDGALNYYIQDLIVEENARGLGIGRAIMKELLAGIAGRACDGATIGLMAAAGKETFYEQLGFVRRLNTQYGAGMTLLIGENA